MYTLLEFQERAVNQLQQHVITAIENGRQQTPILLKAPTGAGKTVMAAALIERVVDQAHLHPGLDSNMAFIWFAPNTLHIQSYVSLSKFYEDTRRLNCLDLNSLSSNPVLNPGDLLFVNWASLSSEKNIWRKENESNTNLETLVENTKANSTKIILIIDEAHLGAFTGTQATKVRNLIGADVEILITATPHHMPDLNVVVQRNEVIKQQLIKKSVRLNIGLDPEQQNSDNVHIHLLRKAFEKKNELQRLYDLEVGEGVVNPLILIQLPSDSTKITEEDEKIRDIIEGLLNIEYNISTNNGKLAIWLSGEKNTDGLEDLNGFQDVLIFKQAIAQGWDCPRAAILLNYRSIGNEDFGIQTVGRILRMPHRRHYNHDDLNHGYVYTDIETSRIRLVPADSDYIERLKAERKEDKKWVYDTLKTAQVINDRETSATLTSAFQTIFFTVMEEKYGIKQLVDIDFFTSRTAEENAAQKKINTDFMRARGWEFDIDTHQIVIPTDIQIDEYQVDAIINLNKTNTKAFAITSEQFRQLFDRFCFDSITRLIKEKSWRQMRTTLINFAEYYLESFEFDARKIFLFSQNKVLILDDIKIALERFDVWQRAKGNENRRIEYADWEIPKERYYSDKHNRFEVESHALEPFYEQTSASKPEKLFKDFLIANETKINYWYKNGDSGREHFAVDYVDVNGRKRLFYVDFIVKMKSGKIGLFDTKSLNSEVDASNKHNALRKWMSDNGVDFFGGILIPVETAGTWNFYFSEFDLPENKFIENTTGFTNLNLSNF
ncbi:DEAD/DEAH box helicase family protein [Flavobacterium cheonanense]|uniref:DEAD/DEAH box helicase family protein n=1 Tax=Flavobacterium cheonanense TaxID=706183 RepID=A0ABP7VW14_9FLAO